MIEHPSLDISAGNVSSGAKFNNAFRMDIYALLLEFQSGPTWHPRSGSLMACPTQLLCCIN